MMTSLMIFTKDYNSECCFELNHIDTKNNT